MSASAFYEIKFSDKIINFVMKTACLFASTSV